MPERVLKFAKTTKRKTQVVKDAFVGWLKLYGPFQTVDRSAIVSVLIEREAEVVKGLSVLRFNFHRTLVGIARAIGHAFLVVRHTQQVMRLGQFRIKRRGG